jgi:hypothetical protein
MGHDDKVAKTIGSAGAAAYVPRKIAEAFRRQLGVSNRVLDVLVTEVVLQRARIDALISSRVK